MEGEGASWWSFVNASRTLFTIDAAGSGDARKKKRRKRRRRRRRREKKEN